MLSRIQWALTARLGDSGPVMRPRAMADTVVGALLMWGQLPHFVPLRPLRVTAQAIRLGPGSNVAAAVIVNPGNPTS